MANSHPQLPRLTAEQRRAATGQFERASQVIASGDYDYGLQLLLNCCVIDPANPIYRQTLRQAQKNKYKNNLKGQSLAFLTSLKGKMKVNSAVKAGEYVKALEYAEQVLMRNPWDIGVSLAMAEAFEELELLSLAIWTLDQVRQVDPKNAKINRPLARLFEKSGNFTAAMALWELVRKADPSDIEAAKKHKDLAASATIAKGRYQQTIDGTEPRPSAGVQETAADQPLLQDTGDAHPVSQGAKSNGSEAVAGDRAPRERSPREVAALKQKIQANPTNPNAYLHLASYYRRSDDLETARQVLKDALGPTANHFEVMMELLDIDIEPMRRDLAMAEEKLARQSDDPKLQALKTKLAKEVALRELEWYRRKADRFPTETSYKFEIGVRLLQAGQADEAIRELQAVRGDPRHHGKALVYLGFSFKSLNNWRLAQRNFEEALNHLTAADEALRKEILYQLARGYAQAGDLQRAVDLACELANVDYSFKDIGALLDEWNAKLQKA